jgi:Rieske Fe-S protein
MIAEIGGERLALYRDADGELYALSPVCTHMKCMVHWNSVEKSWDCPCHGSRFAPDGSVREGPALKALARKTPGPGRI